MKFRDKGEDVGHLQASLMRLGYELPKYGADNDLGFETWHALEDAARDLDWLQLDPDEGLEESASIAKGLVAAIHMAADAVDCPEPEGLVYGAKFIDITKDHDGKHIKKWRPWENITGIVLHQTGVMMSNTPKRFRKLRAHMGFIVADKPTILLVNPLTAYMYHGNSLNKSTVGFEINGNFRGIEGNDGTYWKGGGGPDSVTAGQIAAVRAGIQWVCDQVGKNGNKLEYIYAHRQSNANKPSDPGSKVWEECGVWAQDELGLSDGGAGFISGKGRAIPGDWDGREAYQKYSYR